MSSKIPKGQLITAELLESFIKSIEYHIIQGSTTMVCALNLVNGFTITGQASSLPTTEFDPHLGMKYSRDDAETKLAELIGFLTYEVMTGGPMTIAVHAKLNTLKESGNEQQN